MSTDLSLTIVNTSGKSVGQLTLDPALWGGELNAGVLNQAVAMYRTNTRAGLAHTKTRGDVSGGGKKPFKQKHTGRARAGSTRSPLWRHGGSIFGPRRRDMSYRLPQAIRRVALRESLKSKLRDSEVVILDALDAAAPKTTPFAGLADTFKVGRASAIVLHQPGDALVKSLRNLRAFELRQAANLNAFDVLSTHKLLITKAAFEQLEQRLRADLNGGPAEPHAPQEPTTRTATRGRHAAAS
jgi:large subunit ribosomal protein L4